MTTIIVYSFLTIALIIFARSAVKKIAPTNENHRTLLSIVRKVCIGIPIFFWSMYIIDSFERINPGDVGIVVNLLGNEKGVEDKELSVGLHFIAPWKVLYRFPTFEQNHQWVGNDNFSFQTSEGLLVNADIGITFNLIPNDIHKLFCKYRRGMHEITHMFIRNNIRDAINRVSSKMKIEDLYGPKKEEFFTEVQALVQNEVEPLGFHISHLYIIGKFELPENVITALNKKIESIQLAQQRENELRETEAAAKKTIAQTHGEAQSKIIQARAEADSMNIRGKAIAEYNKNVSSTLTPSLIQYNYISKWDGKMPNALGGDKMPMLISIPNN